MLSTVCPTCGFLFADKEIEFEEKLNIICNNKDNLSKDEINNKITILLDNLNINRYCCRMRIITYIDLAKHII